MKYTHVTGGMLHRIEMNRKLLNIEHFFGQIIIKVWINHFLYEFPLIWSLSKYKVLINTPSNIGKNHITGLSINGVRSHWHLTTHASIYSGVLLLLVENFICQVNPSPAFQWVCFYPFANNSFATSTLNVVILLFFFSVTLKRLFYSFPSVLITNNLILFFYKRFIRGILQ